jgi:hypothetical protein
MIVASGKFFKVNLQILKEKSSFKFKVETNIVYERLVAN